MLNVKLYMLQRLTAFIMAPLVLVHIAVMIYAVQDGLSAGEILSRTQGSAVWLIFYGLFVLAVSIHAAIGLRVILHETRRVKSAALDLFSWLSFAGLLILGARAVYAVTLS